MDEVPRHRSKTDPQLAALQQQLIISLKFHHRPTLQQLPMEMVLQAMMEAWDACNTQKSDAP
jgi:hypothetical protein